MTSASPDPEMPVPANNGAAPSADAAHEPAVPELPWRRLDKRMLLVHPLQTLISALPALLAIFIARASSDSSDRWELIALPIIVGYGLLRWFTTRYRISNGQIELQRGVFTKKTTTARLDRVRTVDLESKIFHRMLGLAKVKISTGSAAKDSLELDSLALAPARALRAELLHRPDSIVPASADPALAGAPAPSGPAVDPGLMPPTTSADEVLVRFDPSWIRYAPFTATGLATAAALLGIASQTLGRAGENGEAFGKAWEFIRSQALWVDVLGLVAIVALLSVAAYVLSFWGFRLTRNIAGSLHSRRGLLTTREVSIDHGRLRGIKLGEPIGLRTARGRNLRAISTGLKSEHEGGCGSEGADWLSPPAPADTVIRVAGQVTADPESITGPLRQHGQAARRRRLTRSLWLPLIVAVATAVAIRLWDWPVWLFGVPIAVVPLSLWLGVDRYRALGHALTPRHLVTRSGSINRSRVVLERDGVIGWTLHQSFFQRRAGVVTLVATTAAGDQHYDIIDLTPERATEVIGEVTPTLLEQFAAPA